MSLIQFGEGIERKKEKEKEKKRKSGERGREDEEIMREGESVSRLVLSQTSLTTPILYF